MARVEVPIVVVNNSGVPLAGAAVQIKYRSNGANAPWYTSEVSATPSTAAVITDANGRVNAWVDRGAYNAVITGTGIASYTEPFDAVPASDQGIEFGQLSAAILDRFIPIGASLEWEGNSDPSGGYFMVEDGRAISRTTYASLFAILGTKHGAGDGSTTFNLPDTRGRVIVGRGTHNEVNAVGQNDGLTVDSRRIRHSHGATGLTYAHTHSISAGGGHTHGVNPHAHMHVYPFGRQSDAVVFFGPGSGVLDTAGSVVHNDNGYHNVQQVINDNWTGHFYAGASDILTERHIQWTSEASPGTSWNGDHDHGGTGTVNSGSFGGTTAEATPAFQVKSKIIRVL